MRTLTLDIPGTPVPKGRPRITTGGGGHPRAITPKKTRIAENWIRRVAVDAIRREPTGTFPIDAPVAVTLRFFVRRPKSAPRKVLLPAKRPDLDNLVKTVLDGLTLANVWTDDARIVAVTATKQFGEPSIRVLVREIDPTRLAEDEERELPARVDARQAALFGT